METYYFYIRTADDDLKIYCFDENEEILKDTGMNFNEYMVDLVERYNPELKPTLDFSTVGELLVQCDTSKKSIIGLKEIREYISSERKETSEIFILFEKYLEKSKKEFTGYNDDEIRGIEELYDIEVKGDFREYLSIAGKSLGGLLGKKEFLLYSDIGVRKRILLQFSLEKELRENELYDIVDKKFFILDYKNDSEYILITTKNNGEIYYYSKDRKILKKVENNFNDYIVKLIKKYNRSLIEIKNDITSGNILNII